MSMKEENFKHEMNKHANLIISGDPKQRQEMCRIEVMSTLQKFRCIMLPQISIRGDGAIHPHVDIVALVDKAEVNNNNGKAGK